MVHVHEVHSQWVWLQPSTGEASSLTLLKNRKVQFNTGPEHGQWHYVYDGKTDVGTFEIRFHYQGKEVSAFPHRLEQVNGTRTFFFKGYKSWWNVVMIPRKQ